MDTSIIFQAHAATSDFISRHSPMIHIMAFFFTPEHKQASNALYAFFRVADDLIDNGQVTLEEFRTWREQSQLSIEQQTNPILIAWADIRSRYNIDPTYEQAALDGFELDLTYHRYETLDELKRYCYGVTVSPFLLAMSIAGFRRGVTFEQAKPYVENIGIAIHLTDIIRDIGDDLNTNRIYLPKSELDAFGLTFADIESKQYDERFKKLIKHFIKIAKDYYITGWPVLNLLTNSFRLTGGFGIVLSRTLLNEIEANGFNVFAKLKIPIWKMLWWLVTKWPAIFWTKLADRYFPSTTNF